MQIKGSMKMADIIHMNYLLLPVINRFGIPLGFGDQTVKKVCEKHRVNLDFFLDITNAYHDENYFPTKHLTTFSAKLIIDYLNKTHDFYLEKKIPHLEQLINSLVEGYKTDHDKLLLLKKFFMDYKEELVSHIRKEEDIVYPYVIEIENAYLDRKRDKKLIKKIKEYSIEDFANEHDNVEEKLYDLKNILIKYIPPQDNFSLSDSILIELFKLEKDLTDHAKIEDKVLIPKIAAMENVLLHQE